jgi:lysozyme
MQITNKHIIYSAGALLLFTMFGKSFTNRLLDTLAAFVPSVEGFRSTPYWDVSRYSWGYGTAAPGATGTISRDQAFQDMIAYLLADYNALRKKVTRSLTVKQWAALLSFSYNLGVGDAYDLVPLINEGDFETLGTEWLRYIHSGGVVNQNLVDRRHKEWALWNS